MNDFYLLRLEISGIKNIEKPIEIPFYKKTIKNDFDPEHYRIKGIYGENGSGKTAVMMAVSILAKILINKNFLSDSVNQMLLIENINKKNRSGYIEAEYYSNNYLGSFIYRYRVNYDIRDDERVYLSAEKLDRKSGQYSQNQFTSVFETRNGNLMHFGNETLFAYCKERTQNLLGQRSFATFIDDIIASGYHRASIPFAHLFNLMAFAAKIDVYIDGEDDHRNYIYIC